MKSNKSEPNITSRNKRKATTPTTVTTTTMTTGEKQKKREHQIHKTMEWRVLVARAFQQSSVSPSFKFIGLFYGVQRIIEFITAFNCSKLHGITQKLWAMYLLHASQKYGVYFINKLSMVSERERATYTRWSEKETCEQKNSHNNSQQQQQHNLTQTDTHTARKENNILCFRTRHIIDKTNSGILFSNVLSRCFDGAISNAGTY